MLSTMFTRHAALRAITTQTRQLSTRSVAVASRRVAALALPALNRPSALWLPQRRFNSSEAASFMPGDAAGSSDSQGATAGGQGEPEPSASVYVGNLFFSVGPQDLEKHMSRFGRIRSVRMLYDNKGLSKGVAFIEYDKLSSADRAIKEMDGRFFEGRPLSVQPARTPPASDRVFDARNQPSDTLFIGNLSFDVSDSDLHSLFASVENVVDVRVAIDRGTGQPRGFAHAEFKDVESAVKAQETLNGFLLHGRRLRVDYSTTRQRRHSNRDAAGQPSSATPQPAGMPIDVAA